MATNIYKCVNVLFYVIILAVPPPLRGGSAIYYIRGSKLSHFAIFYSKNFALTYAHPLLPTRTLTQTQTHMYAFTRLPNSTCTPCTCTRTCIHA